MIWERAVSSPTFWALIFKKPALLMVPPVSLSPGCFSTGMLSPVRADSSTEELPSQTTPSTGTRAPGFTSTMSPGTTSSAGISVSAPSRSTNAVFGVRAMSLVMASEVFPFDRASRNFPKVIRAKIMPDSKYRSMV